MRTTGLRLLTVFILLVSSTFAFAQGGYNDGRVMMQGFMWEPCPNFGCVTTPKYSFSTGTISTSTPRSAPARSEIRP